MASNVVLNRTWIKETYAKSDAIEACQKWVDLGKFLEKEGGLVRWHAQF